MDGTDDSLPLEALVRTVDEGLFVLDSDGRIVWGNAAFSDLVGLEEMDRVRPPFTSVLSDDRGDAILDRIERADDPTPVTLHPPRRTDVSCEIALRELPDGRYAGRLREASRRQQDRELDRYRTMLNTVEDGIYMLDADRRFEWVNDATVEMLGFDREEILGRRVFEFLTEEQIDVSNRNVEHLRSDETPDTITFEMEVMRKDGTTFPAETRAAVLPGDGFTGTVGVIRDVTDRKERERALLRQNQRLDQFARIVSHDLRSPLNVATGRLELAREECDSEHLAPVARAHDRMQTLIDDVLTLAREGEPSTDVTAVSIATIAETGWQNVASVVEIAEATLVLDTERTVRADRGQLMQLFENLFRNAIEYGGADVTVTVGPLADGFYVADDGPGIPPEQRDRVFESGYSSAENGTGLGLSIVSVIADAHGWNVEVTEGSNGGARFEVTGVEFATG